MAWWRLGSCESPTHGLVLELPRLPWRLGSGGGRRSVAGRHGGQPAWYHPGNGQPPAASAAPGQGPQPGGDRRDPADHGAGPGHGTTGRRHGPATGNRYREGWPAGAGRRPGDPEGDQPGRQTGSAWSPQKAATGRNPRYRRRCRRWYAGGPRPAGSATAEITESARRLRQRPEVKRATEQAVAKLDQLSGQATDKLQAARQPTRTEAGSGGGRRLSVVPETPTVTPPSPTVMPPADLAPMPAEPTTRPTRTLRLLRERPRPAPPDPLP